MSRCSTHERGSFFSLVSVVVVVSVVCAVAASRDTAARSSSSSVYYTTFYPNGPDCGGLPLVVDFVDGECYHQRPLNQSVAYTCVTPEAPCAFYHHFSDPDCRHPVNNHTLVCDQCDTEGQDDYDLLTCNVTGNYTLWKGGCSSESCDSCKFNGTDHVGACILTPPHQQYPAVMLLGFGPCPQFVANKSYAGPLGCAGSPVSVVMTPTNVCENNAVWSCSK